MHLHPASSVIARRMYTRLNNSVSYYTGLATFSRQTLTRSSVEVPQTMIYAAL